MSPRPALAVVKGRRCPRCGSALFERPSCCSWRRKGWLAVLKCLGACGYREGFRRAKPAR